MCLPGSSSENHQVHEAVGPEPVGAVNRNAGAFSGSVEPLVQAARFVRNHSSFNVSRNPPHRIVGSGLDRDGVICRVDTEVGPAEARNVRQLLFKHFPAEPGRVQEHPVVNPPVSAHPIA